MTDLALASPLPARDPDAERWTAGLALVGRWLRERKGNTRTTYADTIGYPFHPHTNTYRDTTTLRNGVTWLAWCAANGVHLTDATRGHVVDWTEDLRETPHPETGALLSHATRAHCVTIASAFYKWAVVNGHTQVNPMLLIDRRNLGVDLPRQDSPTRSLSRAEVARLQHAADTDPVTAVRARSSALVALLYRLGMRVSELINADVADIELTGGVRVLWVTLKGGRRHMYKIPAHAGRRLDDYLASRGIRSRLAVRGQQGASTPLFTTASGGRMRRGDVSDLLARLAAHAGLEQPHSVTPHTARHTVITALREAGLPDDRIQRLVGHLDSSSTARYGKHVLALVDNPTDTADDLFETEIGALFSVTTGPGGSE